MLISRVVDLDSCTQVREALRPRLEQRLLEVDRRLADTGHRALGTLSLNLSEE